MNDLSASSSLRGGSNYFRNSVSDDKKYESPRRLSAPPFLEGGIFQEEIVHLFFNNLERLAYKCLSEILEYVKHKNGGKVKNEEFYAALDSIRKWNRDVEMQEQQIALSEHPEILNLYKATVLVFVREAHKLQNPGKMLDISLMDFSSFLTLFYSLLAQDNYVRQRYYFDPDKIYERKLVNSIALRSALTESLKGRVSINNGGVSSSIESRTLLPTIGRGTIDQSTEDDIEPYHSVSNQPSRQINEGGKSRSIKTDFAQAVKKKIEEDNTTTKSRSIKQDPIKKQPQKNIVQNQSQDQKKIIQKPHQDQKNIQHQDQKKNIQKQQQDEVKKPGIVMKRIEEEGEDNEEPIDDYTDDEDDVNVDDDEEEGIENDNYESD